MASGLVPAQRIEPCRVTHLVWGVVHDPLCIRHGWCCWYELCDVSWQPSSCLAAPAQHCTAVCRNLSGEIWSVFLVCCVVIHSCCLSASG
jgi:hypothetical protein